METFEVFKNRLLNYLHVEQDMEEKDIKALKQMSKEDKIEACLMLTNLFVVKSSDDTYVLYVQDNYSKLRLGDKVILRKQIDETITKALVVDVTLNTISITSDKKLDENAIYDLEIDNPNLLASLIGCLEGIVPATPGAAFLRMLSGEETVEAESFLKINPEELYGYEKLYDKLNDEQKHAISSILEFYPINILQGPPGTGKTIVLANAAIATSLKNREVVIIANTHQAVNNALTKIGKLNKKIPLIKIGELLKTEGLDENVIKFQKFSEYNDFSRINKKKKKYGYVVGMTIWGAIANLGLRSHSHFRPYLALVDEASLLPLTYASVLGKCASSICFMGDSRQMPPIFRHELENNVLSESILEYCAKNVKGVPVSVLPETHRMNREITHLVSKVFYEPHGITLRSAESIAENKFNSPYLNSQGMSDSFVFMDANISTPNCNEENDGESNAAIELTLKLLDEGYQAENIAIVTPFRKQVRLLRAKANDLIEQNNCPLIDTVERLQGQDVDCIILSFASSNNDYIERRRDFIFNHNRLNVMISRAKTKVIILASKLIQEELRNILLID